MSDLIFKRDYVLYVRRSRDDTTNDVLEIRDLRCVISVKKTIKLEPNCAEITIYNLAETTRAKLKKASSDGYGYMHLEAGYEGKMAQIFQGSIREVDDERDGPDWKTTLYSTDGLQVLSNKTQCNQTFQPKVKAKDCLDGLIKTAQKLVSFNPSDIDDIDGFNFELPNGFAASGSTAKNITKIVEKAGAEWSIQDGKLQIRKRGSPAKGKTLYITPDSGLIGSPSHVTPNNSSKKFVPHVKLKYLMVGGVTCGQKIAVESERVKGVFMVDNIEYKGDSWSGDWYIEVEARALSERISK